MALAPAAALYLALRPAWRRAFGERLGWGGVWPRADIWLHAASVGEAQAAVRLADALAGRGHRLLVSTATPAGRSTWGRLRRELPLRYAPLDHPWSTGRVLERVRPRAIALVESELWPAWIAAARRRGIPVAVVSARMSSRSFARYRKLRWLAAGTFGRLGAVGARSGEDAERFRSLGVAPERLRVTGDLKFDPPSPAPAAAPELARLLGATRPLFAASTRPGEEEILLDALSQLSRRRPETRLVLALRHLDRIPAVERSVRRRGVPLLRRSELDRARCRASPPAASC